MSEYAIICPQCGGKMDDTNRISTTVLNAHKRMPGGEAYQYIYRCPTCGSTISWTFKTQKPVIDIKPTFDSEN